MHSTGSTSTTRWQRPRVEPLDILKSIFVVYAMTVCSSAAPPPPQCSDPAVIGPRAWDAPDTDKRRRCQDHC